MNFSTHNTGDMTLKIFHISTNFVRKLDQARVNNRIFILPYIIQPIKLKTYHRLANPRFRRKFYNFIRVPNDSWYMER